MKPLSDDLPVLSSTWLRQVVPGLLPKEVEADCANCSMCDPESSDAQAPRVGYFHRLTKCCTFLPELPNFLVGAALCDSTAEMKRGRDTIQARIDRGLGVTPFGLFRDPTYDLLYRSRKQSLTDGFGQNTTLTCPHYAADTGQCTIWRYREATCATWFCKYVRGAAGQRFWQDLVKPLLASIERALCFHCLTVSRFEFPLELLKRRAWDPNTPAGEREAAGANELDELWGTAINQKAAFYRECFEKISGLEWKHIQTIGGAEVQLRALLFRRAYAQYVSPGVLPQSAKLAPVQIAEMGRESVRLVTYSPYDPIELPKVLFDLLGAFDGRPIEQARRNILEEFGFDLEPDLIQRLFDFGILTQES